MTIEEKAIAYDEAKARMSRAWNENRCTIGFMNEIFPKFKENEDERIRKVLIDYFNRYKEQEECGIKTFFGIPTDNILAWLEKQGEQKPADKAKPFDKYEGLTDFERTLADICIGWIGEELGWKQYIKDNANVLLKIAIEKFNSVQDTPFEQKPIIEMKSAEESLGISSEEYNDIFNECLYGESESSDKVELKFKVGDWITNGDYTWKIIEVKPLDYILQSQDGNIVDDTISHVDEQFHSFTIKDAKDGDVLWHSDSASNGIFIFKEIRYDGKVLCYCDYDSEDHFCLGEHHTCCWSNAKYIHPATKEQRDLLFTKMKEAGYEWSEETHELKKISQRIISAEAKEALYDKPSWCEEDEKNLTNTIIMLKEGASHHFTNFSIVPCVDWLKSLKDRVQPIHEYSDTLEVKEVDLEKEFDNYAKNILACDVQFEPFTHLYNCAKYFYELGLKTQKG